MPLSFNFYAPVLVALLQLLPQSASAWGSQGHRVTGLVAEQLLTARTRIALHRLGIENLAASSTWMDDVRDEPEGRQMAPWHFDNRPVCGGPQWHCPAAGCATEKLQETFRSLKARPADPEAARKVKVLIHLVGDLHQPLHQGDNDDHGGNGVQILNRQCWSYHDRKMQSCTLHAYWDTELVKSLLKGHSEQGLAKELQAEFAPSLLGENIEVARWSAESVSLARSTAYHAGGFACHGGHGQVTVDDSYDAAAREAIRTQLGKAGVRVANMLNNIFDGHSGQQ